MKRIILIWLGIFLLASTSLYFYAESMITPIWLANIFAAYFILRSHKQFQSYLTAFLVATSAIFVASLFFDRFQTIPNKMILAVLSAVQILTYIAVYRYSIRFILKRKYRTTFLILIPNLISTLVGSILVLFVPLDVDKTSLFFDYLLEQLTTNYAALCIFYGMSHFRQIKLIDYGVLLFFIILQSLTPFSETFSNSYLLPFAATYFCIRYRFYPFIFLLGCMTLACTITVNLPLIIEHFALMEMKTKVLVGDYRIRIMSLIVVFLFFSELQKVNQGLSRYLEKMSFNDALTNLKNRRFMREKILSAQRTLKNGAVLLLDIDDFKKINDQFGHYAGDTVITAVATFLRQHTPRKSWVFRWGGEEYLILLYGLTVEDSLTLLCESLLQQIKQKQIIYEGKTLHCTFSIGVARFTEFNQDNYYQVIDQADRMLYLAKSKGKNCVEIAPDLFTATSTYSDEKSSRRV